MQTLSNSRSERGFTLVEIMVVVVILGMLATLVLPNVLGSKAEADQKKALADISQIRGVVDLYIIRVNRVPELEDLLEEDSNGQPWLRSYSDVPKDPWGNPYIIRPLERLKYEIISTGPDGLEDTDDDISTDRKPS